MKTLLKILVALVVLLLVVPLATYRTLSPCGMLRKELVRQTERKLEAARDSVREAAGALGKDAQDAADAIASGVQDMAASLAAGAAAARTERMSGRECLTELVRVKIKGGS